jgi:signal peptidase II
MKVKDYVIWIFTPLLIVLGMDRYTKWAAHSMDGESFLFVQFEKFYNQGAILGLFSKLPEMIRIVTFSTGGAFLVFVFIIVQMILPGRLIPLRFFSSVLLGGILGNVIDRVASGKVFDFISVPLVSKDIVFNLADVFQWIGYIGSVTFLFVFGNELWPKVKRRRRYWVDFKYQFRYCMKLLTIGLSFGVISIVFSYTFLRVTVMELVGPKINIESEFLYPFFFSYLIIVLVFLTILFLAALVLSRSSIGPVITFENYLRTLMYGEDKAKTLKIRKTDDFQKLQALSDEITDYIKRLKKES